MATFVSTASDRDYFLDAASTERLYVLYTLKCNFSCSHCLVGSSPARREKMTLEFALQVVETAAGVGIRVIYLTGGEVFLYYREVLTLVSAIAERGIAGVVETNGSWAANRPAAERRIRELKARGLGCLAVSVDTYHQEFGSADRAIRAIEVARDNDLPCRVLVVASPDKAGDAKILDNLDERRIPYFYEALMTVGRGESFGGAHHILQRNRCDSVGATVLPNGDVVACAGAFDGTCASKELPLYAGRAAAADLPAALARARFDPIVRAIDEQGHQHLVSLLPASEKRRQPLPLANESLCGYCHRLLGDAGRVAALRQALSAASAR